MKALSFETFSATDRPWSSEGVQSEITRSPLLLPEIETLKHINPGASSLPPDQLTSRLSKRTRNAPPRALLGCSYNGHPPSCAARVAARSQRRRFPVGAIRHKARSRALLPRNGPVFARQENVRAAAGRARVDPQCAPGSFIRAPGSEASLTGTWSWPSAPQFDPDGGTSLPLSRPGSAPSAAARRSAKVRRARAPGPLAPQWWPKLETARRSPLRLPLSFRARGYCCWRGQACRPQGPDRSSVRLRRDRRRCRDAGDRPCRRLHRRYASGADAGAPRRSGPWATCGGARQARGRLRGEC